MIDIQIVNKIALEAGQLIMEIYQKEDFSLITDFKSDSSPLTLADKESNNHIVKELNRLYPEIPIISEEEKEIGYEVRKNWKKFWLVDPLDGTKEFIKRNGEFTVNIALIENGYPVAGVIYAPDPKVLYYAEKGKGAFKTSEGKTVSIKTTAKNKELISMGSRSHASEAESEFLKRFNIIEEKSKGSSLKFCLIAEGLADLYYRHGPTMEWDTAAGQAILEEAGGRVLNPEFSRFSYNKTSLTNGSFICLNSVLQP